MITEDYVSFETAKLLKEKGFDEPCKVWYAECTSVWGGDSSGDRKYINIQFDDKNRFDEHYKFLCYAPTLQMVMKWLREEKDIIIEMHHLYRKEWYAIVSSENPLGISVKSTDNYSSYEEACEAAIKYCLENLI